MKTISSSLQTFLLDNTEFNRADLISIILPNGQVMNVLFGTNYTSITYPTGLPSSVTVNGATYPWLPADPTYPFSGSSGTSPVTIAMTVGQTIQLQYSSGTITTGAASFDANGSFGNPTSSYPGSYILGTSIPPIGGLIGGFVNASGFLVAPPFFIGNNSLIGPAPAGTVSLSLGSNSLTYSTNSGSWAINVVAPTYYYSLYGVWERGAFTNKADFKLAAEVLKLTATIPESVNYPGTTTSLMQTINQGAFTGAQVIIQTLFWPLGSPPSSGFSLGVMQLTKGQIGNVKNTGRSKIEFEVFDLTYILNRPFPPHLIQTSCRHTFCDHGCTLIANTFTSTPQTLVSSSSTLYLDFSIASRANTTAYIHGNLILLTGFIYMCTASGTSAGSAPAFNSGRGVTTTDGSVTWTSLGSITPGLTSAQMQQQSYPSGYVIGVTGQNTGIKRTVKVQGTSAGSNLELQLLWPLPFAVAAGDTFKLVTGCDKSLVTCETVYNNLIHIGAEPLVPNPEIAQLLVFALGLGLIALQFLKHFI